MRKIAIFVEGQTELITVREFLLREFNWNGIEIQCRTFYKKSDFKKVPYDVSCPNPEVHFQIINVGNDESVLTRILQREKYMWNSDYEKIIGLRDMYSKAYREDASQINNKVTEKFIKGAAETIKNKAKSPEKIKMCFAIMEIEAWFLGMYKVFEKLDNRLTAQYIKEQIGIDMEYVDPQTEFFHPANEMEKVYKLAGMSYDKHKGDIEAIVKHLSKDDYTYLHNSHKCNSFKIFYDSLSPLE